MAINITLMSQPAIAVVGVGRMGAAIARRFIDRGCNLTAVYDVQHPVADALAAELGVAAPALLREIKAELVFTVVNDDASMHAIFMDPADNLLMRGAGCTFINCATVTPSVHKEIETVAEAAGASSLEACMASSIPQALAGTLYLMCAGRPVVFERVKEVLALLSDGGRLLRYIGPTGKAAQLKALVNMVMNCNTAALAEGLGLADALGLELALVREVFSQTGANSRVLETDGEDMQNRDHTAFFSSAHAAKDSGIALRLAESAGLDLPLARATRDQYDRMILLGLGDLDKSGISELTFRGRGQSQT